MPMSPAARERHEKLRAAKFREVVEDGAFYGQPHSEPVEQGETDTKLGVGGRRFGTTARKADGGYVVNGRIFSSLWRVAPPIYATPAIRLGDEPWIERTLYLKIPKDVPGVSFPGEWDPMGMRATVSRDMLLQDVFVPDDAEVLPPGLFGAMYNAFPHLFLGFSATFLGLMQAAYDGALAYLTGRMPGAPIPHTQIAAKGHALAEMLFAIESARALYYRAISEAQVDAPLEAVQRARAAHVTVQRAVVTVTQEAIRVCGGRAFLRRYPLERYARDARAAALMRPWTRRSRRSRPGRPRLAWTGSGALPQGRDLSCPRRWRQPFDPHYYSKPIRFESSASCRSKYKFVNASATISFLSSGRKLNALHASMTCSQMKPG